MPELAASYAIGALVTLMMVLFVLWREYRTVHSLAYRQLQQNLASIDKKWSDSLDKIVETQTQEGTSFLKSMGIFGVFCVFLSWLGLFFFILIYVSIRVLTRSIRSQLLTSELAQKQLSPEQIQIFLKNF